MLERGNQLLGLGLGLLLFLRGVGSSADDWGARVNFANEASVDVDVFWRDDAGPVYRLLTTIGRGLKDGLNTFRGHKFLVAPHGISVNGTAAPNFVMARPEQDMVIKGDRSDLMVVDSAEGRRKLGLPPRRLTGEGSAPFGGKPVKASVLVRNEASLPVAVYWRNDQDQSYAIVSTVPVGGEVLLNTFRGHSMLIQDASASVDFHKDQPNYQQMTDFKAVSVRGSGRNIQLEDGQGDSRAAPLNKAHVTDVIRQCSGQPACIATLLFKPKLAKLQKHLQDEMDKRDEVEEMYRDWACSHQTVMVPQNISTTSWVYDPDNEGAGAESQKGSRRRVITVERLFESQRRDARIMLLSNIVSEKECSVLQDRVNGRLQAAAVTGSAPGEKLVSKARKAKAALVKPDHADPTDVLADLRARVFAFVNEHTGQEPFGLAGQEPFNVIMYNVSGDEYKLHCDGYCDSSQYILGGRAATVVLYCEDATRGGQTTFTNADIVVKGKPGQAAFFHYKDSHGYMDAGWTKHSGCPVLEGTKWISTQWIRYGVSDEEPWYLYTPTGDRDYTDPGPRPEF